MRSRLFPVAILAVFSLYASAADEAVAPRRMLFIGNSFTFGAGSPVQAFHPETITNLNKGRDGGVPALFKAFTVQAGLAYDVSIETAGGKGMDFHVKEKAALIGVSWDAVCMHGYSTMDKNKPGDPELLVASAGELATLLHDKNPAVDIRLEATWSRADQTYPAKGHWSGKSIDTMARDVRSGYNLAAAACPHIKGVIPVGEAWNRAMSTGFADPDPYDGTDADKVTLWANDRYHGSTYGYYLSALTIFGAITGLDPRSLGENETAAAELGISPKQAMTMQQIAFDELTANQPDRPLKAFKK